MKYPALLFLLLFVACGDDDLLPDQLRLADSLSVDGSTLRLDAIVEDSRCPCEASCIWEGRAVLQLLTSEADTLLLSTGFRGDAATIADRVSFNGRTVVLEAVDPYPCNGLPETPEDYRITLTVE